MKTMKFRRIHGLVLLLPLTAAAGTAVYNTLRNEPPALQAAVAHHPGRTSARYERPVSTSIQSAPADAMRGELAELLLDRWSGHVEFTYGTPRDAWKRAMRPTLARLDRKDLAFALDQTDFDAMIAALNPQPVGSTGSARPASVEMAAGKAVQASATAFNVLSPCRLVDTRNIASPISAGSAMHVRTSGPDQTAQGGAAQDCGVPANARAVVLNVTAVLPEAAGYLTAHPYGAAVPLASSLNYTQGAIVGNEIIVAQSAGQPYAISVYSYARSDLVVDVVGYFSDAPARRMSCRTHTQVQTLSHANYGSVSAECPFIPSLYRYSAPVGGGCRWLDVQEGAPAPGQLVGAIYSGYRYGCDGDNFSGVSQRIEARVVCCDMVSGP